MGQRFDRTGTKGTEMNQTKSGASSGRGGYRKGAGRKPGSANKKTRAIADKAAETGQTPLEVMIDAMRAFVSEAASATGEVRLKLLAAASSIAKDAAPYMHPRLQAIEHSAGTGSVEEGVAEALRAFFADLHGGAGRIKHVRLDAHGPATAKAAPQA